MLASLAPATTTGPMVTINPLFVNDNWARESRIFVRRLGSSLASPKGKMSSSDAGPLKKRESRSGTRKVSALSADQLERKRANDREAQRSIRQRTKEHIEQLENMVSGLQMEVTELQSRNARYADLVRRNASLEDEVRRLKHRLAAFTGRPVLASGDEQPDIYRGGWAIEEGTNTASSNIPTTNQLLPTHFAGSSRPLSSTPRATSAISSSSRSSHPHDWTQQYSNTRSPSLDVSPDADLARMDPYLADGQMHQPSHMMTPSISVATSQLSFSNTTSPTQPSSDSPFPQIYPIAQYQDQRPKDQPSQFFPSQRSIPMSMPSVTASTQPSSTSYHPPYPSHVAASPQGDQNYSCPWIPQA